MKSISMREIYTDYSLSCVYIKKHNKEIKNDLRGGLQTFSRKGGEIVVGNNLKTLVYGYWHIQVGVVFGYLEMETS